MQTEIHEHKFEVGSPAALLVKNIRGDVEIQPGEDGVILVKAVAYLGDGDPDDTRIDLTQDADGRVRAEVRSEKNGLRFGTRKTMRVDFHITAPLQTDINARLVSGSVEAAGFSGRIDIGTVSGAVRATDLRGELDLDTVSGKLVASRLHGRARVSGVSGRVSLHACDFDELTANIVSGRLEVETDLGVGPYNLKAVSGSLLMVVPPGSGCQVDASAVSGRFTTDLDVSRSSSSKRRWHVVVGEGGPSVRMNTVSGRMRLLSSFDAEGRTPGDIRMSETDHKDMLERLSKGEITVEDAMKQLAP